MRKKNSLPGYHMNLIDTKKTKYKKYKAINLINANHQTRQGIIYNSAKGQLRVSSVLFFVKLIFLETEISLIQPQKEETFIIGHEINEEFLQKFERN